MNKLKRQMLEDKALRDTAQSLITADAAHVRNILSAGSLGKRVAGRIRDGASDVYQKASDSAGRNRGILAAAVGAAALWFVRKPIMALLNDKAVHDDDSTSDTKTQQQLTSNTAGNLHPDEAQQDDKLPSPFPPRDGHFGENHDH